MARTDIHRVGAIIPAHYSYVMSYALPSSMGGWPVPSIGINCELDHRTWFDKDGHPTSSEKGVTCKNGEHRPNGQCCVIGLLHVAKVKFTEHGGTGKCSICGASFIYGDVWVHDATGEHLHVGHTCAAKYEMVADRTDFEHENAKMRTGIAALMLKTEKELAIKDFLTRNPGLEDALKTDHRIVKDIAAKLPLYLELSDAQVALVMKLANEAKNPTEKLVPAPSGKTTFTGKVVSLKTSFSEAYGTTWKMTVKIETPAGNWLAWGTCPKALLVEDSKTPIKGKMVEVTATLSPGHDAHFAKMGRPSGKLVAAP